MTPVVLQISYRSAGTCLQLHVVNLQIHNCFSHVASNDKMLVAGFFCSGLGPQPPARFEPKPSKSHTFFGPVLGMVPFLVF